MPFSCYNVSVVERLIILCVVALSVLVLLLPIAGCQQPHDVVENIHIMKADPPGYPPPPSGWALKPADPHAAYVQAVFEPREKMMLGLVISDRVKREVTFSRFTFFNKGTGAEVEVPSPDDLGPFEPGGTHLMGYPDPWDIPDEDGEYELRVYLADEVVSSALFNVGIWPESWGPEMEVSLAPIHEVRVIIEEPHPPPDPWVWVYIKGGLPDSCSQYKGGSCQFIGNTINIKMTIQRPKEAICAQVYGYFEKYWAIGGDQYIPGETYTVNVNDYTTTFVMP